MECFTRTGFLKALVKSGWRPMAGGAVGRDGIIPTAQYLHSFPESMHEQLRQMLARPLTADVVAWRESERALMARVQGPRE